MSNFENEVAIAKHILEKGVDANGVPYGWEQVFKARAVMQYEEDRIRHEKLQERIKQDIEQFTEKHIESMHSQCDEIEEDLLPTLRLLLESPHTSAEDKQSIQSTIENIKGIRARFTNPKTLQTPGPSNETTLEHYKQAQYMADAAEGVKIDQCYENINYRFNPVVYGTPDTKLQYISESQRCGLLMHKNNGGDFLPGNHHESYTVLQKCLEQQTSVTDTNIKFTDNDYAAFEAWCKMSRDDKHELGLKDIEMLLIKAMNVGKVGSVANIKIRAIATADTQPLRRFRPWVSDNYVIAPVRGLKFEPNDKNLFVPIYQTPAEIQAEYTLKKDLEAQTGREVNYL